MGKHNWGRILLSSAGLAALSAAPALAQDAADAPSTSDEIVVTATGRSAAIQDVPIAVQAIPSETLEQAGVKSLRDLNQLAPTLTIGSGQSTTSGTIASIRGIGTGSDNPGFEGAVGIFIDGVYRARAGAALADLPEVQRIEVLRGPQGTLFGKNTSAGAISVVTAGPSHDFGAWGEMEVGGDQGEIGTAFGATGGITDNLAVRFDANMRGADGFIKDQTSGRDEDDTSRWNARAQALWDINPDASFRFIVDGGRIRENCCGAVDLQPGTGALGVGPLIDQYFGPGVLLRNPADQNYMTISPNRGYGESADDFGVSGELDWDLGGIKLTSISAYRNWASTRDQDIDFTSIDRAYRDGLRIGINNWSEELRLQGEVGKLNWLVGGFVSQESLKTTDTIRFGNDALYYANAASNFITANVPPKVPFRLYQTTGQRVGAPTISSLCLLLASQFTGGPAPGTPGGCLPDINSGDGQQGDHWETQTDSIAAFTHDELNITDNLVLTLGARFTHETKDMNALLNSVNAGCDSLQGSNHDAAAYLASHPATAAASVLFSIACNPVTNTQANGPWADSTEENEWSGTTSLAYHLTPDLMLYGGYSRGYKAGGFNLDRSGFFGADNRPAYAIAGDQIFDSTGNPVLVNGNPTFYQALTVDSLRFKPEFTNAYELGFKSTILGGTTYFNANLFYEQIEDYQSNAFSGFNFFTLNVPELVSKGVEVEVNARPTDRLTLVGGVLYDDAYYNSTAVYGEQTIAKGTTLSDAPKWTVTGSVNYRMPVGSSLAMNFFLDGRYITSTSLATLSAAPVEANDAFAIFDARVSLGGADSRWSVEAFVHNLADEHYLVGAFGAPERTLPDSLDPNKTASNYFAYPSAPRTWGITLRARY